MIGRQFSHYRVVEKLGAGGMGSVYRAEDTLLGRMVALKFPHAGLVHDEEARKRFLREARVASALDHPNIVVLYDVCEIGGEIFIAMQWVPGSSLRERLRGSPHPVSGTVSIGRAVADALQSMTATGSTAAPAVPAGTPARSRIPTCGSRWLEPMCSSEKSRRLWPRSSVVGTT